MKAKAQLGKGSGENGAALLIAIFALLLVSVVAIALIISSGTDSALAGNYRSSANAYYAALAGIEEARGRLLPNNANCIELPPNPPPPPNTPCNLQPLIPMPLNQVVYITNPAGGEVVAPEATGNPATYPDLQYKQEFGVDVSTQTVTKVASVSTMAGLPGPSFKWARINAVTEQSMGNGGPGVDVDSDGNIDAVTPLFYNPVGSACNPTPGLVGSNCAAPPATAGQALEITSFATLPNGSQKMLQYVVRPMLVFPDLNDTSFPAALTLAGNNVAFSGPGTSSFYVQGQDQCAGSNLAVPSIGYTNNSPGDTSLANINNGSSTRPGNYQGGPMNPGPPQTPQTGPASFAYVGSPNSLNSKWLTPSGLDAVVQDITNNADAVIQGPARPSSFPPGMSATHPMTIVVNGDLDFNSWTSTGYGLLVVTGTLKYDPDATWEGIILVIGQGSFISTLHGVNGIDGAMFIAKTRDAANNLLPALGAASFSQGGGGPSLGRGIYYNSCIIKSTQGPITYKVVAFKEIPLLN